MRPIQRHGVLLLCLLASLGASAWTYWRQARSEEAVVVGRTAAAAVDVRRQARLVAPSSASDVRSPEAFALVNRGGTGDTGDIAGSDPFAVKSWQPTPPPAPPPPPPVPPSEPMAPALPFKYMGRQEPVDDAAATVFYLSKGSDAYVVRVGDKLDNEYQLDSMDGGVLRFTYLPLSLKQTLPIGIDP